MAEKPNNMGKTGALNLGSKGFVIVILSFLSCYMYSALTSDSLNVTVGVFGGMGMNTNAIYALSSVATICGIIGSIFFGAISEKRLRMTWALAMCLTGVFALIWSTAASSVSIVVYAIGYLVCYTTTLVSAMLLSFNVLANWFPRKRGVALGIATAGFPLSAATTTAVCSNFAPNIGRFYVVYGIFSIIIGIIIFLYVRDFPEEKGAYPDNDRNFDIEAAKKEHEANLAYLKTSKWTIKKCVTTGRMWQLWLAVSISGFLSMGIMSNFVNKFMEGGYQLEEILGMLAIVGISAIPGSIFTGWLDVQVGTKKTGIFVNCLGLLVIILNLTPVHVLHYISLPMLGIMLGGSSNIMTSTTAAIWGRYDFQNAFRVIQPLNAIMTGIGITVVGIVGTNVSYFAAYVTMLILQAIGAVAMITLKVEPIDQNVR